MFNLKALDKLIVDAHKRRDSKALDELIKKRIAKEKEVLGLKLVNHDDGQMYEASAVTRDDGDIQSNDEFLNWLSDLKKQLEQFFCGKDASLMYMHLLAQEFFLHDKKNISNNLEKFLDLTSTVVKSTYLKYYNKKG